MIRTSCIRLNVQHKAIRLCTKMCPIEIVAFVSIFCIRCRDMLSMKAIRNMISWIWRKFFRRIANRQPFTSYYILTVPSFLGIFMGSVCDEFVISWGKQSIKKKRKGWASLKMAYRSRQIVENIFFLIVKRVNNNFSLEDCKLILKFTLYLLLIGKIFK